jgi:anti-sigma factor RsiW
MTSPPEDIDEPVDRLSDRALWQRCRLADAPEDEDVRLLDLAAFAEGGIDPDEHERIAALLVADPNAAADVAAATSVAGNIGGDIGESPAAIERIVARASALRPVIRSAAPRPASRSRRGLILPFFRPRRHLLLHGVAQWGSLAAAIAMAAWLGFSMGSDASLALSQPTVTGQDNTAIELFDPATGFLHDMSAGVQT